MLEPEEELTQFIIDLQTKKNLPVNSRLLFVKVWGSYSHGTQVPESDIDFLAIYESSLHDILRIHPPKDSVTGNAPDFQAHEVGRFCELLLKGNPAHIECLFTDQMSVRLDELNGLWDMRDDFINVTSLKQYFGYGRGQLARLKSHTRLHTKGGEYNTKWAYHLIRLMHDAERIARGEPPEVVKHGDELRTLMDIRAGNWTPQEIEAEFLRIQDRVDSRKPWPIPEQANESRLNDWLYSRRLADV